MNAMDPRDKPEEDVECEDRSIILDQPPFRGGFLLRFWRMPLAVQKQNQLPQSLILKAGATCCFTVVNSKTPGGMPAIPAVTLE